MTYYARTKQAQARGRMTYYVLRGAQSRQNSRITQKTDL